MLQVIEIERTQVRAFAIHPASYENHPVPHSKQDSPGRYPAVIAACSPFWDFHNTDRLAGALP